MISDERQLLATLERITWFQLQVAHLRKTETSQANYRAAVSGFRAEIDRMQLEARGYLGFLPAETPDVEATVKEPCRAPVTVLDVPTSLPGDAALIAEPALADDWSRPEEDAAWSYLQPRK